MGHDIAPGTSYCPQGHPLALEAVQFAGNAPAPFPGPSSGFGGGPTPGYGAAPPAAPSPYGAAPPPYGQPAYGAPQNFGGAYAPPVPAPYAVAPAPPPYGAAAVGAQGGAQGYASPGPPMAPPAGPNAHEMLTAGNLGVSNIKVLRGFLVAFQPNPQGDFWPLYVGRHVIGRSNSGEALDIPLPDATISSRHAALTLDYTTGSVVVEDTGSTNGTFVNDEHLGFNGRRELRDGDRVRFGGFTVIVKVMAR